LDLTAPVSLGNVFSP